MLKKRINEKVVVLHHTWSTSKSTIYTRVDDATCRMLATAVVVVEAVEAAIFVDIGFHSMSNPATQLQLTEEYVGSCPYSHR